MADGRLIASEEVLRELEKKADDLHAWARQHDHMFAPTDAEIQGAVRAILARPELYLLVDSHKNRSWSDPFVIALAKLRGCVVVSQEFPTNNPTNPKIPDACRHLGIRCISLLDLILEEGWVM